MKQIQVIALFLCLGILPPYPVNSRLLNSTQFLNSLTSLYKNVESVPRKQLTADVNEYVDDVLENLRDFLLQQNLDSSSVPDTRSDIKWLLGLVPIFGKISLKDGTISGFSTIYRRKSATVSYKNEIFSIHVPLGFKKLMVDYKYSASILGLGPWGRVKCVINTLKITIDLDINLHHLIFKLTQFSVDGSGFIYTNFTGFILTDLVLEILTTVVANLFRGIILNKIEGSVHKPLEGAIDDINKEISKILRP